MSGGEPEVPGSREPGRVERDLIHQGRIFSIHLDRVRFPDGSHGTLELLEHPGAAAILPFVDDPRSDDPRVLLIRQYRYAAGGFIYEVPAGIPDASDEPWDDCARRELEEETGYRARHLRHLTDVLTTPGFTDEVIRLYAAWDLERGDEGRDADEFIEVVELRFSEAMEMARDGRLQDAKSLVTLLYAESFFRAGDGTAP